MKYVASVSFGKDSLAMLLRLIEENKHLDEVNCKLRRKIGQLEDNWNKLRKYLHNVDVVVDYSENYDGRFINYDELLDKMQEIEKGSDSNGNNKTIFKQIN